MGRKAYGKIRTKVLVLATRWVVVTDSEGLTAIAPFSQELDAENCQLPAGGTIDFSSR
jgi:hypothetical protein